MRAAGSTDVQIEYRGEKLVVAWDSVKSALAGILQIYNEEDQAPQVSALIERVAKAKLVKSEAVVISNVLVTATETTTRIPLDILVPLPGASPWDASKS